MRFRIIIWRIALISAVIFFSTTLGYISGARALKERLLAQSDSAPVPIPSEEQSSSVIETPKGTDVTVSNSLSPYVLKEYNGKIALFSRRNDGSEKLWQTYDISPQSLPEADRIQLKKGIEISGISEALQIIEDYSS